MARKFLIPIDLNNNQLLNALLQQLGVDPTGVESKVYYNTTDHAIHVYNGTVWLVVGRLDQITAPTASVNLNSQKITGLADGTSAGDAVNKSQLDAAITGLSWKTSVRAATTANGTLASAFENGDAIDGVTLATGDRILLKNQTDAKENGIYVVAASGAPARAGDANAGAELRQAAVFVEEGSTNADTAWTMTFNGTPTIGSDNITWALFSGANYTAGAGLTLTGSTLAVGAGTGIVVNADDVALDIPVTVAHGGTGGTDAAGARTNLGFAKGFTATIGDNSTTAIAVTHSLGTKDVVVSVRQASDDAEVECDVVHTSTTVVTLTFSVAPATNAIKVVVIAV